MQVWVVVPHAHRQPHGPGCNEDDSLAGPAGAGMSCRVKSGPSDRRDRAKQRVKEAPCSRARHDHSVPA